MSVATVAPTVGELWLSLTPAQLTVAMLVMDGLSNKEIAARTGQTDQTIKVHVRGICRKLGTTNRVQIATLAWEMTS